MHELYGNLILVCLLIQKYVGQLDLTELFSFVSFLTLTLTVTLTLYLSFPPAPNKTGVLQPVPV